jgi:hypothetical protein
MNLGPIEVVPGTIPEALPLAFDTPFAGPIS